MVEGMSYLLVQTAFPLVVALLLGGVAGWLIRSGRDRRRGADHGEGTIGRTSDELASARQSIETLLAELSRVRDEKDTELGRLETHAIQAVESTMARSTERIQELETELAQARAALQCSQDELTTQRGQTERLRQSLAARDVRIAELAARR